jgi:hypothetical protein
MFNELRDELFDIRNREIVYYTACLGLYRVSIMISSGKLPSNFRRMKWHLLLAIRMALVNGKVPNMASVGIDRVCKPLIDVFSNTNPVQNADFARAVEYIRSVSKETRGKITARKFSIEMQRKLAEPIVSSPKNSAGQPAPPKGSNPRHTPRQ